MKIVELLNKVSLSLTNEEADLLGRFHQIEEIRKKELNEREQVVASNLVNKDVLTRFKHEGKISYKKKIQ